MVYPLYVFDAYGTVLDVHGAVARYSADIGPQAQALSTLWRTKQLEYTWVRTLAQRYQDFYALTRQALDFACAQLVPLPEDLRLKLMRAYEELPAYDDVLPTLRALKAAGARTAILSNGTSSMLATALHASGLAPWFDKVLSVDQCAQFKTSPAVYQLVLDECQVTTKDVSFQSSNRWDVAGAQAFGFRCLWINRTHQPDEYRDLSPDGEGHDLNIVVSDLSASQKMS
jgi:2-haloacid dehalogenase